MSARFILILAAWAVCIFSFPAYPLAQVLTLPEKRPPSLSGVEKVTPQETDDDDDDGEEEEDGEEHSPVEDPLEATSTKGEVKGIPPLPSRGLPPSLRAPRQAVEPLGPEPPPEKWSGSEIEAANTQCAKLLKQDGFEFKALEPIREGICGTPAPIALKYFNHAPRVEIRPAATMTCQLANALDRWLVEVVQPRAKALLQANVIRVANLSAYQCRSRYNDPTQRISYHAFADAIDIAEFMTAKGERINVLDHWPAGDERSQFLKDIHSGACKVFGTVLGPEANAAHKNHFHFDMAKRRHSAYCQ